MITKWYFYQNPDVAISGLGAWSHWFRHGRGEGRYLIPPWWYAKTFLVNSEKLVSKLKNIEQYSEDQALNILINKVNGNSNGKAVFLIKKRSKYKYELSILNKLINLSSLDEPKLIIFYFLKNSFLDTKLIRYLQVKLTLKFDVLFIKEAQLNAFLNVFKLLLINNIKLVILSNLDLGNYIKNSFPVEKFPNHTFIKLDTP